jgi:ElaB/YqjD/DUF883 family membrane-anchored ribosome-binding protein
MKTILGLATQAFVLLVVEEKAREVAGDATVAYGEAVEQARGATRSLSRSVEQQPWAGILIASGLGYILARLTPRH